MHYWKPFNFRLLQSVAIVNAYVDYFLFIVNVPGIINFKWSVTLFKPLWSWSRKISLLYSISIHFIPRQIKLNICLNAQKSLFTWGGDDIDCSMTVPWGAGGELVLSLTARWACSTGGEASPLVWRCSSWLKSLLFEFSRLSSGSVPSWLLFTASPLEGASGDTEEVVGSAVPEFRRVWSMTQFHQFPYNRRLLWKMCAKTK